MLKTRNEIKTWLDMMKVKNYTINEDLTVDVNGGVDLSYKNLSEIMVKFNIVKKQFNISANQLNTLNGCPEFVGGDFDCSSNQLISLKGCPKIVKHYLYCQFNELKSLEGFPQKVIGVNCSHNKLTSLKGIAKTVDDFLHCEFNELKHLTFCPKIINGDFCCKNNKLVSLKNGPEKIGGDLHCENNKLKSLKYCPEIKKGNKIFCAGNKLSPDIYAQSRVDMYEYVKALNLKEKLEAEIPQKDNQKRLKL